MADLVNLRQFRKQKKRQNDETKASKNRVIFGRTKVERNFDEKQKQKTVSFLDLRKIRHDKDEG
ncbi:DUF4169 family protein [uncultured Bartonella sp.]|uniref:DUF4169 family protein n=1 Tax=uncultured Bartonella sp. TaxID=104108 RepID=UPI0025D40794|nr:DUF4169 family protein [uncultured Bartonella sp.]